MEKLKSIIKSIGDFLAKINDIFHVELFSMGDSSITLGSFLYIIIAITLLIFISGKVKKIVTSRILKKYDIHPGNVQSIAAIIRYSIMTLGVIIIIQSAGVDLSALSILAGALGVGIGFGLQNITNNFTSGLIILFEQPIKVGDRVKVGEIEGNVVKISARATTVNTNDNITLIIPNAEFINSTVINWSHNDRNVALRFPVGVSYKEDPAKVKKVLMQVISENPNILANPEPQVLFNDFGDSSLNFIIRVWTTRYSDRPRILQSELYFSIFEAFKENNIEIPYPQRDVHIK